MDIFIAISSTFLSAIIGIAYIKRMKSAKNTLKQAFLAICGIGIILWPICFITVHLTTMSMGGGLYINELGVFKYTSILLAFSLFIPLVHQMAERYL